MGEENFITVLKKATVTKWRDKFDFEQSVFLPVFDSCTTMINDHEVSLK